MVLISSLFKTVKMNKRFFVHIITYLFIVMFIYAAISKILDFQKFRVQIAQSVFLNPYAGLLAWIVPLVEILITLLLCFAPSRQFGFYASFTLMMFFTLYIIGIL